MAIFCISLEFPIGFAVFSKFGSSAIFETMHFVCDFLQNLRSCHRGHARDGAGNLVPMAHLWSKSVHRGLQAGSLDPRAGQKVSGLSFCLRL